MLNNGSERYIAADKGNYLNLVIDDFYVCKGTLKVYKAVCPTLLSERWGLKVVVSYGRKIHLDKTGN